MTRPRRRPPEHNFSQSLRSNSPASRLVRAALRLHLKKHYPNGCKQAKTQEDSGVEWAHSPSMHDFHGHVNQWTTGHSFDDDKMCMEADKKKVSDPYREMYSRWLLPLRLQVDPVHSSHPRHWSGGDSREDWSRHQLPLSAR